MPILDPAEARLALGVADDDTSVDDLIDIYVGGVTKVIERHLGQVIDSVAVVERRWLNGRRFALNKVPVVSLDSLVSVDSTTVWSPDDFIVDGESGIVEWGGLTGDSLYGHVVIGYTAGYATVPADIKSGAATVLRQMWEPNRGVGTEPGSEQFDTATAEVLVREALVSLGGHMPVIA